MPNFDPDRCSEEQTRRQPGDGGGRRNERRVRNLPLAEKGILIKTLGGTKQPGIHASSKDFCSSNCFALTRICFYETFFCVIHPCAWAIGF